MDTRTMPRQPHGIAMNATDPELVAAAQQGDESAFATLAGRYSTRVRRILVRITADDDAADDALQDALLRAWKNIHGFQGRSGFFTWLTRIAINEAHRTRQRADARSTLPLDDALGERIPTWGNQPDEIFETREFLDTLDAALARLPEEYRAAVVLRDIEGLDTSEAASILEVGEAALKSRLHRGRMALRREMDSHFKAR
jgi:RNA polymerase sigma-70 factor (ECF subfamily)